jgi:hypothetical protein
MYFFFLYIYNPNRQQNENESITAFLHVVYSYTMRNENPSTPNMILRKRNFEISIITTYSN